MKKVYKFIPILIPFLMMGCSTNKSSNDNPNTPVDPVDPVDPDEPGTPVEETGLDFQTLHGVITYSDYGAKVTSSTASCLVTNQRFSKGTLSVDVLPNGSNESGMMFLSNATNDTFYELHVTANSGNKLVLNKYVNNVATEMGSCYITAGYNGLGKIELKVIISDNKIQCFYENKLYISRTDTDLLTGDYVGLFTNNQGSEFTNITLAKDKNEFKTVNTLITGHSYMELWSNYKNDLSRYEDIYNIGIGGTSSPDWYDHIEEVVDYNPSRLIYMIGINDVGWKTAPSAFMNNVKKYVDPLLTRLPEVEICLVSVNICPLYKDSKSTIDEMNRLLRNYVANTDRVSYADIDDAFLNSDGTPDDSCFVDGLHPTANAYLVIRDAIYDAFDGINQPEPSAPTTYNLETGKALISGIQANATGSNWTFSENKVTTNSTGYYLSTNKCGDLKVALNFSNYNPSDDTNDNPFFSHKATKAFLFGGSSSNGTYVGYALHISKDWIEILQLNGYTATFIDGFNVDIDTSDIIFEINGTTCSFSYGDGTAFSTSYQGNTTISVSGYKGGLVGLLCNDSYASEITIYEFSYSAPTESSETTDSDSGKALVNEIKANASTSDWEFTDNTITTNSIGHYLSTTSYTNFTALLDFTNYNQSTDINDNPFFSHKATKAFLFGGSDSTTGAYSGFALNISKDWIEILKLNGDTFTFVDGFNRDLGNNKIKLNVTGTTCTLTYEDGSSLGTSFNSQTTISLAGYTGGKLGVLRNDSVTTNISIYEIK